MEVHTVPMSFVLGLLRAFILNIASDGDILPLELYGLSWLIYGYSPLSFIPTSNLPLLIWNMNLLYVTDFYCL